MMPNMMHSAMMTGISFFWLIVGIVVGLTLLAISALLLVRWLAQHKTYRMEGTRQPKDEDQAYEQGYQAQQPETYQEDKQIYSYPQLDAGQTQAQRQEVSIAH